MSQADSREMQMELTGPGRRLMEARCALNLSRDDVARQLRLKPQVIAAIEEDRVEELPAPIYVLGYLRNYAQLLRLPHEPIVDAYQQLRIDEPPVISEVVQINNRKTAARVTRWGSIVVALVVLAGFVSWLTTQEFDFLTSAGSTKTTGTVDAGNEPVEQKAETTMESGVIPTEQAPVESLEPVVEPAVPADNDEAVSGKRIEEVITGETVAAPGQDKLSITLLDDCWVEITDSNNETLIYDLLRKGRSHEFHGVLPFRIFLGNAAAVKLELNGKAFDISPYINGKLARFTMRAEKNDG